ncbi:MAG: glycosyltransferase family 4 protein [Candidatus Phaeomarinobacter sp.]
MEHGNSQPTKPGVLQVIPQLDAGGAERSCVEIASAVAANGWRSFVATNGGRLESELMKAGVTVFHMDAASKNPMVMLENIGKLRRIIRARDISIVHARSRAPAWSAMAAANAEHRHFVTTYHSKVHDRPRWKVFYNSVMARGEAVIANSQFTADRIMMAHGTPVGCVHPIPRGFDLETFDPDTVDQSRVDALKAEWGVSGDNRPLVLLPARLTRWKGPLLLIEAAAKTKLPARFVIAGDAQGRDDFEAEVRDRISELGLMDQVTLAGHITDMAAAYKAADIVVSASLDPEPFGRIGVEAQAMGRRMIAPDHGGAREQFVTDPAHERTGWLFEPGNADALAAVLDDALAMSAEDVTQMGARARKHALSAFTSAAMCTSTLDVYRNVLSGKT